MYHKRRIFFSYQEDSGITGAEQNYIYIFKSPECTSEQELQDICAIFDEYMLSAYF
ncbi:hypothetical protein ACHPFL_000774 [Listeria monocytogenes]